MTLTSIVIRQVLDFLSVFLKLSVFLQLAQLCQEIVAIKYLLVSRWLKSSSLYFQRQ